MKIAWFSPLPPAPTDIGNYTMRLLPHLESAFQIELYSEQETAETGLSRVPVKKYLGKGLNWRELNQFDFSVYHLGNNLLFHKGIWEASLQKPGVIVLHDEALHDFFFMFCRSAQDREGYLNWMKQFYGEQGCTCGEQFWKGMRTIDEMVQKYPLTELGLMGALGVVVHTRALFDKLKTSNGYPIAHLNLPYNPISKKRTKEVGQSKPYSLVVFGHLGRNRRIEQILSVLSEFPNKDEFTLTIMGELWDRTYVSELIRKMGLGKRVEILGYVPEEELNKRLSRADMALNLRYPTMGEASGSQLRIWDHALPSLVTKVGWYAELPANTVFMVDHNREREEIRRYLQMFLDNPEEFRIVGENGRKHLLQEHGSEKYVKELKLFLEKTTQWQGKTAYKYLSARVAQCTQGYIHQDNLYLLRNAAQQISSLL